MHKLLEGMEFTLSCFKNASRRIVSFIMAAPALLAALYGYIYFTDLSPAGWQATDWYISNDFGFTRRGLLGGSLRALAITFDWLSVNWLAYLLTIIAAFAVSVLLILKARTISLSAQLALAFSPVFYQNFILWDPAGGGRKDALAIIFVLIYLLLANAKQRYLNTISSILAALILPLLTLVHEAIFFFCAPILIFVMTINWINRSRDWSKGFSALLPLARSLSLFIPTLIALLAALVYSTPSVDQVESICRSWQIVYSDLSCIPLPAAFSSLAGTENYGEIGGNSSFDLIVASYRSPKIYAEWIFTFGYVIALMAACFVPLVESSISKTSPNVRYAIAALLAGLCGVTAIFNAPLYLLAIDYGRWLSVSLTLILATCLIYQKRIASAAVVLSSIFPLKVKWPLSSMGSKWLNLTLIFISCFTTLPHSTVWWNVKLWLFNPLLGRTKVLINLIT